MVCVSHSLYNQSHFERTFRLFLVLTLTDRAVHLCKFSFPWRVLSSAVGELYGCCMFDSLWNWQTCPKWLLCNTRTSSVSGLRLHLFVSMWRCCFLFFQS